LKPDLHRQALQVLLPDNLIAETRHSFVQVTVHMLDKWFLTLGGASINFWGTHTIPRPTTWKFDQ